MTENTNTKQILDNEKNLSTSLKIKQKFFKFINHPFFSNDYIFAWVYLSIAIVFLAISIPSYLLPEKSHYIILGGLIPMLILNIGILLITLVNVFYEYKKEFYKSWKFYLVVWMLLCCLIGLPISYHYLVSDFATYASYYKDKTGDSAALVHYPKDTEITIGIWFDIIFTFMNMICSVIITVFSWRENNLINKQLIIDDKKIEEFINETHAEVELSSNDTNNETNQDKQS